MTDIAGRTAFITGGANGIGLGIARALARAGARLALADLDAAGLERARLELGALTPVETVVLDVTDRAGMAAAAERVEALLGPVSLLVNNAGVAAGGPATKLTYDLWDWGMGINLDGVINGVQTFLPRMAARKAGGHIVNTASGAGLAASGAGVLYHTAKFAVVGLSEALQVELQPEGIGVSVLCPGPVATDILARTRQAQPGTALALSDAQRQIAEDRLRAASEFLARGVPPDQVGEMVRTAIETDRLYIHTDRFMVPFIEARTAALLGAMPEEGAAG